MANAGMSRRHASDRSFFLFPGDRATGLTPPQTVALRRVLRVVSLAIVTLSIACCSGPEASHKPEAASPASRTSAAASLSPQEAATSAFHNFLTATDQASEAPTAQDWEADIRRFAADPAASQSVQSVRELASLGLRQVGDSVVTLTVDAVQSDSPSGPTVLLSGCYDVSSSHIENVSTGQVVPSGTPSRYALSITVTQYLNVAGRPWLVRELDPHTGQPC